MRHLSRWAMISLSSILSAALIDMLGVWKAERMVAAGDGFEMAFYWSPFVFQAIDVTLIFGIIAGLIGITIGPGVFPRIQAIIAMIACVSVHHVVPWR